MDSWLGVIVSVISASAPSPVIGGLFVVLVDVGF